MNGEKRFWLSAWAGFALVTAFAVLLLGVVFGLMNTIEAMKEGLAEWCSWLIWIVAPMFMACVVSVATLFDKNSTAPRKTAP